jgi:hypothetical protein
LHTYTDNNARISYLRKKFAPSDICLLYNPNSVMSAAEVANWTGGTSVAANNGLSDPAKFNLDFASISQPAIIMSADPYFHHNREPLIAAANASGKYICYPLNSYRNVGGKNKPSKGYASIWGPDIHGSAGGYYLLGGIANSYLMQKNYNFGTSVQMNFISDL